MGRRSFRRSALSGNRRQRSAANVFHDPGLAEQRQRLLRRHAEDRSAIKMVHKFRLYAASEFGKRFDVVQRVPKSGPGQETN